MPNYSNEIEVQAVKFRAEHHINNYEPINCNNLLLRLNVLTVYKNLSDDFSGMCLKQGDDKFILINSRHSVGRQHFTIAHELYHLFIQKEFNLHFCNPGTLTKDLIEKKADCFASNLLMPELGLKTNIPENELREKKISISTILILERLFSVSHAALLIRLKDLKLLDKNQYEEYSKKNIRSTALMNGYDTSLYESGNEGLVIGDYGIKAKKCYDEEKISEGHYRELMSDIGIDLTDIEHV
ncbi:MAG: ImmA/IrrE family metallo-endopeptidase [Prevotella sp.]|jgi:Zn-dependent peptidase ImmA (M78 family)|nr:ImmA/IrrE family metallo-endopeptidase [Prevotella sp.]